MATMWRNVAMKWSFSPIIVTLCRHMACSKWNHTGPWTCTSKYCYIKLLTVCSTISWTKLLLNSFKHHTWSCLTGFSPTMRGIGSSLPWTLVLGMMWRSGYKCHSTHWYLLGDCSSVGHFLECREVTASMGSRRTVTWFHSWEVDGIYGGWMTMSFAMWILSQCSTTSIKGRILLARW